MINEEVEKNPKTISPTPEKKLHTRMRKVLREIGENEIAIKTILRIEVGGVCYARLKHKPSLRDCLRKKEYPMTELEIELTKNSTDVMKDVDYPNLLSEIINALKKHPNVIDLQFSGQPDNPVFDIRFSPPLFAMTEGKKFSLKINLPKRFQYLLDLYGSDTKNPVEEFEVLSDGSIFLCYTEVDDYGGFMTMGAEFRNLLEKQIEKESIYSCEVFGPSPIHPDIYLIYPQSPGTEDNASIRIYEYKEDIFIILQDGQKKSWGGVRNFLPRLFDSLSMSLQNFYILRSEENVLGLYHTEIFNRFYKMSKNMEELLKISRWRILKSEKIIKDSKKDLSVARRMLVEFESESSSLLDSRSEFLDSIKDNDILGKLTPYFAKNTKSDKIVPQAMFTSIGHYADELRAASQSRLTIVIALVSISSIIAGAILTEILRRLS